MNAPSIVIVGSGRRTFALAAALTGADREPAREVTVVARFEATPTVAAAPGRAPRAATPPRSFVVVALDSPASLASFRDDLATRAERAPDGRTRPDWIACLDDAPDAQSQTLTDAAYAAGALAVLPATRDIDATAIAVSRLADRLDAAVTPSPAPAPPVPKPVLQHHRAGTNLSLPDDRVLLVRRGVVAQHTWHEDGTEGLLGLWGPDQAILGHPDDGCFLTLRAHTDLEVELVAWSTIASRPDLIEMLRQRTLRLESWASMQSRPNVEQRLLGILHWLGEQFGTDVSDGTLIEIRVTHAQLAAAIGATRATVTRMLGQLRRQRTLRTESTSRGERLVLRGGAALVHSLRASVGVGV